MYTALHTTTLTCHTTLTHYCIISTQLQYSTLLVACCGRTVLFYGEVGPRHRTGFQPRSPGISESSSPVSLPPPARLRLHEDGMDTLCIPYQVSSLPLRATLHAASPPSPHLPTLPLITHFFGGLFLFLTQRVQLCSCESARNVLTTRS